MKLFAKLMEPQTILFTNPDTVSGTMTRLQQYAQNNQKTPDIEVIVIENTFELFMRGEKEAYQREVANGLKKQSPAEDYFCGSTLHGCCRTAGRAGDC